MRAKQRAQSGGAIAELRAAATRSKDAAEGARAELHARRADMRHQRASAPRTVQQLPSPYLWGALREMEERYASYSHEIAQLDKLRDRGDLESDADRGGARAVDAYGRPGRVEPAQVGPGRRRAELERGHGGSKTPQKQGRAGRHFLIPASKAVS